MFDEKQAQNVPENWFLLGAVAPVVPLGFRSSGGRGGRSYRSDKAAESNRPNRRTRSKENETQKEELVLIGMSARPKLFCGPSKIWVLPPMEQKRSRAAACFEICDGKKAVENYNSAVKFLDEQP